MKNLTDIIKANPGCRAEIDNDNWTLYRKSPWDNPYEGGSLEYDKWDDENVLAQSGEVEPIGEGHGSGNCYGGDILQALAQIVGIKVDSV